MTTTIGIDINLAADFLRKGELVGMPTETVYGLAASIDQESAIRKIYEVKKRPATNPLIVHIANKTDLEVVALRPCSLAKELAEEFWPGPLTMILSKSERIPDIATAGSSNLAVRMPATKMALSLIKQVGAPLVAPSANPFTRISPTSATQVKDYFDGVIPYVLDGGPSTIGIESTIIRIMDDHIMIVREGSITAEHLKKYRVKENDFSVHHPGNYKKHYAPNTPLYMVPSLERALEDSNYLDPVIIAWGKYSFPNKYRTIQLSQTRNLEEAASNLYRALHEADALQPSAILIEPFPNHGIGKALNERLRKAATNNQYE